MRRNPFKFLTVAIAIYWTLRPYIEVPQHPVVGQIDECLSSLGYHAWMKISSVSFLIWAITGLFFGDLYISRLFATVIATQNFWQFIEHFHIYDVGFTSGFILSMGRSPG